MSVESPPFWAWLLMAGIGFAAGGGIRYTADALFAAAISVAWMALVLLLLRTFT